MLEINELKTAIKNKDANKIATLVKTHNLVIKDNKITATQEVVSQLSAFWDKRQLVKKINLNSLKLGRI